MRAAALIATCVALLASARSARAAGVAGDVHYALGWTRMTGAETCIAAGALARAVEMRVGYPAWVASSAADVVIEGYVERRGSPGWHAHMVLTDAKGTLLGQRDVENDEPACETLDQPLTLMLALILDPQLLIDKGRGDPARVSTPVTTTSSEPTTPAAPPAARTGISGHVGTDVGLGFAAGLLPGVATGLLLTSTADLGSWSFELGGAMWFPSDVPAPSGGARLSLAEIVLRACPFVLRGPTLVARGCAGAQGGVLVAQGFGFDDAHALNRGAFGLNIAVEGALQLAGPMWLGLRLSGIAPMVREQFTYTRGATNEPLDLFRMSVIAGSAQISLGVDLGS